MCKAEDLPRHVSCVVSDFIHSDAIEELTSTDAYLQLQY